MPAVLRELPILHRGIASRAGAGTIFSGKKMKKRRFRICNLPDVVYIDILN